MSRRVARNLIPPGTRRRRPDDERTVEITPTPKGRALERDAARVPIEMASVMGISDGEERKLRQLLQKLTASILAQLEDVLVRA